jgi:hypothetical protein
LVGVGCYRRRNKSIAMKCSRKMKKPNRVAGGN